MAGDSHGEEAQERQDEQAKQSQGREDAEADESQAVTGGASQKDSQQSGGTMGLEPAGAAGWSAERDMRRWERIAGLTEEGA